MRRVIRTRIRGLTLIELLITLAVMAVLIAIAAPSFKTQILNSRSAAMSESISNTLNFARSEALKRKARVTVCGSTNGAECNSGDWTKGMLVVVDTAVTDAAESPVVGEVLQVVSPFATGSKVGVSDSKEFVRYLSSGAIARIDNNPLTINIHVEGCTGNAAKTLSISLSGSISIAKAACPTGG